MADKAISELISAEQITATDMFVLEQNGTAKKLTGQVLLNWLTRAADGHGGIQSIVKHSTSGLVDTYRITLADTTTFDFVVNNGRGINSITKTGTAGLEDTYTIRFDDNTSSTFTVTNGAKGDKGDNQYVWIKYASQKPTASSHSFGDVADNWIGIYSGASASAPTDWTEYEWFQIKGEKGDKGDPARLISSAVDYQVSDSGTIIPSGAWSSSVPVVAQGKYLWTRTTTTFNTGSSVVSYSVSRMGLDGSGSVSSVANISPDENGNVPLTAADIGAVPSAGGVMTGELNMNGQPISGMNMPTANDQAANMGYVNQQVKKAAPRNLLDNSDFTNPVNQRGVVSGTEIPAYTYFLDRWKSISNIAVVSWNSDVGLYANALFDIHQYIQNSETLVGKTLTLAAKCSGKTLIATRTIVGATSWDWTPNIGWDNTSDLAAIVEDGSGKVYVQIGLNSDGNNIEWAALYEGEYTAETLPEYQPKGYGAELAECQRYYYQIGPFAPFGLGFVDWDGKMVTLTIPIGVQMRVNPSVLENITVHLRGLFANGFTITGKTPTADVVSNTIKLTYSDVFTDTQYPYTPVVAQLGSDAFVFNADL